MNDQAGYSRDARAMVTAFETLNRSMETFLTRLSWTNDRSEKSKMVFKKPRYYKDESDGCIDTWIEVMLLHIDTQLNIQPRQKLEYDRKFHVSASYFFDKIFNSSRRILICIYLRSGRSDISIIGFLYESM